MATFQLDDFVSFAGEQRITRASVSGCAPAACGSYGIVTHKGWPTPWASLQASSSPPLETLSVSH